MNRPPTYPFLIALLTVPLAAQVVVNSDTVLVIDSREPGPLRKAAADLASDMRKVFGKDVLVKSAPQSGRNAVCIALNYNLPGGIARPSGNEQLHIRAIGKETVLLTGSDLRGAIYAVYEFSRRFLGVDPMWWWTDHEPARRASVRVPAGFARTEGPTFRYRGWFVNDEDLLTGWKPGTADKTGIALEVWDKLFEALLRLKGNMIVPGTFIFPYEPQVRAAAERGLIVTQHHIEVLGLNTWRWPDDKPYSFFSHPDLLVSAWRRSMSQYDPKQEVLWTLGYRGRHDRPFWSDDKSAAPDDEGRARAIRNAIDRQIEIVRSERRDPYFLMNAWAEAVPLIQKGLLKIPDGVTLVWPDGGNGLIRDEGRIAKGQGIYYHTAMLSGQHNQLSEMSPPDRIRRELGRAVKVGATEYLLDNISDLRPVVMTTRALMEMAWDAKPWMASDHDESSDFIDRWSREEYGAKAGPQAAACYRAYFAAPARYGDREDQVMADNYYHTLARTMAFTMAGGSDARPRMLPGVNDFKEHASRIAAICREAEPRWLRLEQMAAKAAASIPADRREFFQGHVRTQAAIHLHSSRMLLATAQAALAATPGAKSEHLNQAVREVELELEAFRAAEYGKWAGFYKGELFVNVRHTLDVLRYARASVAGGAPGAAPRQPDGYVIIKAYQGDQRTQF